MTQAMTGRPAELEEPPCIWALAGVLSYRPCDRHYDCERCPLFHALSDGPAGAETTAREAPAPTETEALVEQQVNGFLARMLAGCTLHLDRAYSPDHWWMDTTQGEWVTLGIEPHVLRLLQPVNEIVTPPRGTWLRRPEACGWIRRGRTSLPLHAPISGEVEQVNKHYLAALVQPDTFSDGDDWLLRVSPHEDPASVPGLYRGAEALAWHLDNVQRVKRALNETLEPHPVALVGPTLADGGVPAVNLEGVLGHRRFDALVDALFRRHAS
jgi:glycine cleavage system H lipoate-binding protein